MTQQRWPLTVLFVVLTFLLGSAYFQLKAQQQFDQRLTPTYWKNDVWLQGQVDSLPKTSAYRQQFLLVVDQVDEPELAYLSGQTLLLKNYHKDLAFKPCQSWRLQVRLKPVRGLANGLSFNYQQHLFSQGIQTQGYVRAAERLAPDQLHCIDAWRYSWRNDLLERFDKTDAAWLAAISIGDKSLFDASQRQMLQELGIFHLFVISGLHIGLVAAVIYTMLLLMRRCGGGLLYRGDWRLVARILAFTLACFYGLLAGAQLPVQRALITLFIFMFSSQLGLRWTLWQRFMIALTIVLLWQPLAVLQSGFWLSFSAVFFLLLINQYHLKGQQRAGLRAKIRQLITLQVLMSMALMPLLMLLFGQWSALMIVANSLLIPLMSLFIIPMVLMALLCWFVPFLPASVSIAILTLLQQCFAMLMPHLTWGQAMFNSLVWQTAWPISHFIVASVALFMLLGPNIFYLRQLGVILLIASCLPQSKSWPAALELKVQFLDVGQGLSVLLQTPHHQALFDTGASWDSGSMVDWVHRPLFQQQGILYLDKLIISHSDNDHSGGLADLKKLLPITRIESSGTLVQQAEISACKAGQSWRWDKLHFTYLHPDNRGYKKPNNQSCVLFIETETSSLLLTGDIEAKVEAILLNDPRLQTIDVLQVPHHGSKTSSTEGFLALTKPRISVISAGFLNRFQHPHSSVLKHYRQQGSTLFNTADDGKITLYFYRDGRIEHSVSRAASDFFPL